MDVDDEEDPVPEITKRHFEEAMKFARRYIYNVINQVLEYLFLDLCPIMISRSMRCSARPCSSPEGLAPTSGSQMVKAAMPLLEGQLRATSIMTMTTTCIAKMGKGWVN